MPANAPRGLDAPYTKFIIKWMSRITASVYKRTGGRIGGKFLQGAPVALLTTIGRKSGEPRTAPLLYLREGERFVVVASQGGLPKHPAWYLNLRDVPQVTIQVGRDRFDLVAHTADDAERAALWPKLVDLYADFDTYAAWTDRAIPVVICEPR